MAETRKKPGVAAASMAAARALPALRAGPGSTNRDAWERGACEGCRTLTRSTAHRTRCWKSAQQALRQLRRQQQPHCPPRHSWLPATRGISGVGGPGATALQLPAVCNLSPASTPMLRAGFGQHMKEHCHSLLLPTEGKWWAGSREHKAARLGWSRGLRGQQCYSNMGSI